MGDNVVTQLTTPQLYQDSEITESRAGADPVIVFYHRIHSEGVVTPTTRRIELPTAPRKRKAPKRIEAGMPLTLRCKSEVQDLGLANSWSSNAGYAQDEQEQHRLTATAPPTFHTPCLNVWKNAEQYGPGAEIRRPNSRPEFEENRMTISQIAAKEFMKVVHQSKTQMEMHRAKIESIAIKSMEDKESRRQEAWPCL